MLNVPLGLSGKLTESPTYLFILPNDADAINQSSRLTDPSIILLSWIQIQPIFPNDRNKDRPLSVRVIDPYLRIRWPLIFAFLGANFIARVYITTMFYISKCSLKSVEYNWYVC